MKKKLIVIFALSISFIQAAFAIGKGCSKLELFLVNATENACSLEKQALKHGAIIFASQLPHYLPPFSTTTPVVLAQPFIGSGPAIELTYRCGNNKFISLYTKQNYCFLQAGDITARITNEENMKASRSIKTGSYSHSLPGKITWTLQNK